MRHFIIVSQETIVLMGFSKYIPEIGPAPRFPEPMKGCTYVELDQPFNRINNSPSVIAKWENNNIVWEETATLEEVKLQKNAEITAAKIAANGGRFIYMGEEILVDEASFREMQSTCAWVAMTQSMPNNWPGGWKTVSNTYVPIPNVPGWVEFYGTMVQSGLANFNRSQQLKLAIAAASTHEELLLINW